MEGKNEMIVQESGKGKYVQEVVIGSHTFLADEPSGNGGNDLGPSPYDFLLAALGTCTSMTLRAYADAKKIPLEKAIIKLRHEKTYTQDCANCESKNSKIDSIDRTIELKGALTEAQQTKLLEIANKCPVHRTLTSSLLIHTRLL